MKGEMSVPSTARPSSARTFTAAASVTTSSRPSPGRWSYTPSSTALSRVDLPWNPPPTTSVTPTGTPIPVTRPLLGRWKVRASDGGEAKGTAPSAIGSSDAPLRLGSTDPSPTKATRPAPASCDRRAAESSTHATCAATCAASSASCRSAAATYRGRHSTSVPCAARPSTVRPCAGSATVKRASTASSCTSTAVRSTTCWPGASTVISPPLAAPHPAPAPRRTSAPAADTAPAKARAT
mmetsp:Transcript_9383/g.32645  ORF Transcript_9383/g.32645 Transcript_9383/m.32645 type:complete len:238 (-) Transcript_9383:590-1303(-)